MDKQGTFFDDRQSSFLRQPVTITTLRVNAQAPNVTVHLHFGAEQKNVRWNDLLYIFILSIVYFLY